MARVLVTGAAGFIGSNLVRALLAQGDEVHACVRKEGSRWRLPEAQQNLTLHEIDLTTGGELASAVARVQPDHIFHLAHYGGNRGETDESLVRRIIIDATAELYAACMQLSNVPRVIHMGSSSEYGTKHQPMKETMLPEPNSSYGCAKLWATLYGEHLRRDQGVPITTLRLFSAYGPFEAKARLVPAVTLALLTGTTPNLANPSTSRDFIYIDDVVDALIYAANASAQGVYNIGRGENVTLKMMVDAIHTATGSNTELTWGGDTGQAFDTTLWLADTTRTREELGWEAKTSLEEGVAKTVAWFKENSKHYEG